MSLLVFFWRLSRVEPPLLLQLPLNTMLTNYPNALSKAARITSEYFTFELERNTPRPRAKRKLIPVEHVHWGLGF
jgi:hypothetical protein